MPGPGAPAGMPGGALPPFQPTPKDSQPQIVGALPPAFEALSSPLAVTTTVAVPYPSPITAGDLLVLYVGSDASGISSSAAISAGFTEVGVQTGGAVSADVWWKVATGTETGTITVTVTSGTKGVAWMERFGDADNYTLSVASSTIGVDTDATTTAYATTGGSIAVNQYDTIVAIPLLATTTTFSGGYTGATFTATGAGVGTTNLRTSGRTGTNTLNYGMYDTQVVSQGATITPTFSSTATGANATGLTYFLVVSGTPVAGAPVTIQGTATAAAAAAVSSASATLAPGAAAAAATAAGNVQLTSSGSAAAASSATSSTVSILAPGAAAAAAAVANTLIQGVAGTTAAAAGAVAPNLTVTSAGTTVAAAAAATALVTTLAPGSASAATTATANSAGGTLGTATAAAAAAVTALVTQRAVASPAAAAAATGTVTFVATATAAAASAVTTTVQVRAVGSAAAAAAVTAASVSNFTVTVTDDSHVTDSGYRDDLSTVLTDSAAVTDPVTSNLSAGGSLTQSLTDTSGVTDAGQTYVKLLAIIVTDDSGVDDNDIETPSRDWIVTVTDDSGTTEDPPNQIVDYLDVEDENSGAADVIAETHGNTLPSTLTDTSGSTDSIAKDEGRAATDTAGVVDSVVVAVTYTVLVSDVSYLTDDSTVIGGQYPVAYLVDLTEDIPTTRMWGIRRGYTAWRIAGVWNLGHSPDDSQLAGADKVLRGGYENVVDPATAAELRAVGVALTPLYV